MSDTPPTPPPAPPAPEGRTFSQDEVTAIATREAEQAARAERQRIDAYLAEQAQAAEREQMAEVDRLRAERDEARSNAEQAQAAAQRATDEATASRLLIAAGMAPEKVSYGLRLLDTLDETGVTALTEQLPDLFTPADGGTPPPKPGIPPARPPAPSGGKTAEERARERFDNNRNRPGFRPTAA